MAFLDFNHISIKGVSACVPKDIEYNKDVYMKWGGFEQFLSTTGIEQRHKASENICSSDLCIRSVERLISDLNWNRKEIDAVIFVTQTPDYILPATSTVIQKKLDLSESCYTLDISLGCSGWVYALSILTALMQNGTIRKGLLLAGDTILKLCSPEDKSTYPLFGDAGTATALEYDCSVDTSMKFCLNSDGKGYNSIIIRDGGYRNPVSEQSFINKIYGDGIVRNQINLELDGMNVFSFGISKAPQVVNELVEHFVLNKEEIDFYTFHQANFFMNEKIRKKMELASAKVLYSLKDFGNTSCASIPLTLVTQIRSELQTRHLKHISCGFGVGLSWGAVYFETKSIICPDLIKL